MKFEIDQLSKKLQSCKQENETLKSDLHVSDGHCCNWWLCSGSVFLSVSSNFLYQSQRLMFVSRLILIAAASSLICGCLLEFDGAF